MPNALAVFRGGDRQFLFVHDCAVAEPFARTHRPGSLPLNQPCERIAYTTGGLSAAVSIWCGILLLAVAGWLVWELWTAVAPKPISDDFLKLLDDSFARDWRRPRTWPWTRLAWAYGFTALGAASALSVAMLISSVLSSSRPARTPAAHVETSQRFRLSR